MKTALISVSDKTGLEDLGHGLVELGFRILSTGGTAEALRAAGVRTIEVADYTGFPELMGGRLKTLNPKVFGGILGRRGIDDSVMTAYGIWSIDLVVVNLYPFQKTVAKPGVTWEEAIEKIDVGGPSMLRAAAKNHEFVTVVVDPTDYDEVLSELRESGTGLVSEALRRRLAGKIFVHTSNYDAAIAWFMGGELDPTHKDDHFNPS